MSYHNIIIKYQNNIVEELILFTHQYTMSCRIVSYSQMNLFVSDQVEKFSQVLQPALSMFFLQEWNIIGDHPIFLLQYNYVEKTTVDQPGRMSPLRLQSLQRGTNAGCPDGSHDDLSTLDYCLVFF